MAFDLDKLVRENVKGLLPYSSARDEFDGTAEIFLDANENAFGSPLGNGAYSRYPDPLQNEVKEKIAELSGVRPSQIFAGNGSDEAIDLLIRIFCRPQIDDILICPPTYGMYEVAASVNDVAVRRANLTGDFELDIEAIKTSVSETTKLIFLCSPNNPTGNLMHREAILQVARFFDGIVAVDEAYIHFSTERSLVSDIDNFPNLVVLQTFSKAWGLAGLRVGLAFAGEGIIKLFNKIKPPYNVSQIAQETILNALTKATAFHKTVGQIVKERTAIARCLGQFSFVTKVYPSDANFLLVKTTTADDLYSFLLREKIVVRNRSRLELCEGCVRITIGTPEENQALTDAMEKYEKSLVY